MRHVSKTLHVHHSRLKKLSDPSFLVKTTVTALNIEITSIFEEKTITYSSFFFLNEETKIFVLLLAYINKCKNYIQ